MKKITKKLLFEILGLLLWAIVIFGYPINLGLMAQPTWLSQSLRIVQTQYQGWQNAWILSNEQVQVVVVPEIGRIMQFRFKHRAGTFWENSVLQGKPANPHVTRWMNFGGDKVWPAPQSDWDDITGRSWPPPATFDAMPHEIQVDGNAVTLVSQVDPDYGIRTYRTIQLDSQDAVMSITSTYEKVSSSPQTVSVWTITQLRDPTAIYAFLPQPSLFQDGYIQLSSASPANLQVVNGVLSLIRDPKQNHKIGTDASTLLWVGTEDIIRIDAPRLMHATYPDGGSSAEIYTNRDLDAYVELEFLSPLKLLNVGDRIQLTTTYTLMHRTEKSIDSEVRKLLQSMPK